jgi:hypothetical protein
VTFNASHRFVERLARFYCHRSHDRFEPRPPRAATRRDADAHRTS